MIINDYPIFKWIDNNYLSLKVSENLFFIDQSNLGKSDLLIPYDGGHLKSIFGGQSFSLSYEYSDHISCGKTPW